MIELKNVTKQFENGVYGLKNIDLRIEQGEFVAIIGLSGAGKSTLLRTINRLNEISQGEVFIEGQSITKANQNQLRMIRRRIGMIFQQFHLVKQHTVQLNVLTGRMGYYSNWQTLFGLFKKEDYERVNDALARVGLSDKLKVRCDRLSGGQQQRVSIARAIVQEAEIILADEPVASLDPITTLTVLNDLKRINQELNKTIILNIHSIELARKYATRIIGVQAGQIIFDGKPEDLSDVEVDRIYLKESIYVQS